MIADRFVPPSLSVLDVGCGRGFFSFACARKTKQVTCLDLMDGRGRTGWWREFRDSTKLLKLGKRVSGVRGDAASLPFVRERFDVVTSVHAVRNFRTKGEIRSFFLEALRTLKKGGRMILAESDIEGNRHRAYNAFYSLRVKLGYELDLPQFSIMVRWLKNAGFAEVSVLSIDIGLKYAPVRLPYDRSAMKGLEGSYRKAERLVQEEGDSHPPILVLTATKP